MTEVIGRRADRRGSTTSVVVAPSPATPSHPAPDEPPVARPRRRASTPGECRAQRWTLLARAEGVRTPLEQGLALAVHLEECPLCHAVKDRLPLLRTCCRVQPWLDAYPRGGLGNDAHATVAGHLGDCALCRAELAAQVRVPATVHHPELEPPVSLASITSVRRPRPARWLLPLLLLPAAWVVMLASSHHADSVTTVAPAATPSPTRTLTVTVHRGAATPGHPSNAAPLPPAPAGGGSRPAPAPTSPKGSAPGSPSTTAPASPPRSSGSGAAAPSPSPSPSPSPQPIIPPLPLPPPH